MARPLAGGPLAFALVRPIDRSSGPVPVMNWPDPLDALTQPRPQWAGLPPGPHVMGILNVTPDSFSGSSLDHGRAVAEGEQMLAHGASVLDVGGESTRPGAEPVPAEEEQRRILPVISALARAGALISTDTRNAGTMARALDAGAAIVNDVSALRHDPEAAPLVAARRCPVILMHMRGTAQTMRQLARYRDVAAEVLGELSHAVRDAEASGIAPERIAVDPGFGFAKTPAQSRELLARLPLLLNLPRPIIAGLSRKGFVGEMAGVAAPAERGPASIAAGIFAIAHGAAILRVHDVAATMQAVRVWKSMSGWPGPAEKES